MGKNELLEKWWQRPQPVWVSTLLSTLVLLALFGLWNIIQQGGSAFEGDTTTLETSQSATAQSTGGTVPYQGFVSNANGQPLNGNQTMSFALYAVSTGGTAVWGPETHTNIPVVEGLFAAVLGSKTTGGIPNSVWENGSLYVQTTINGEALTPREPIYPALTQLSNVAYAQENLSGWTAQGSAGAFVEELEMQLTTTERSLVQITFTGTLDCTADCYVKFYRNGQIIYHGPYIYGADGHKVVSAQFLEVLDPGIYNYQLYLDTTINNSLQRVYGSNFTAVAFPTQ